MSRASLIAALEVGLVNSWRSGRHASHLTPFLPQMLGTPPGPAGSSRHSPRKGAQAVTSESFAFCWSLGLSLLVTRPGQLRLPLHKSVGAGDKRVSLERAWDTRSWGAVLHLLLHAQLLACEFFHLFLRSRSVLGGEQAPERCAGRFWGVLFFF